MSLVAMAVGGVVLTFVGARVFLSTPPERLAGLLRTVVPYGLMALGVLFLMVGQMLPAIVAGAGGAAMLIRTKGRRKDWPRGRGRLGPKYDRRRAGRWPSGPREVPPVERGRQGPETEAFARVRSHFLEMVLHSQTGDLSGTVLTGQFAGRTLESLEVVDVRALLADVASDPESVRLLEAYLDRRLPGWRAHAQPGVGDGLGGAPGAGAMTEQEAHQILGLQQGATVAEIRDAHRRLMKRVHPDHGGTDFLAARINEAKALLIDRHH